MNFENHIPIYLQIITLIKKDIILGHINPGDKLPSVRDYAVSLKVNPNTVQKAYQEMERDGLAYSRRGIGRFIIEDFKLVDKLRKELSHDLVEDYVTKMREVGYTDQEIMIRLKEMLNGG